ncbi:hypothetical protein F5146DRAFT_774569 [Armillaria mellea]|nr:hypothetical protein F5146DRAFT_774569 [Armillaria mellea]
MSLLRLSFLSIPTAFTSSSNAAPLPVPFLKLLSRSVQSISYIFHGIILLDEKGAFTDRGFESGKGYNFLCLRSSPLRDVERDHIQKTADKVGAQVVLWLDSCIRLPVSCYHLQEFLQEPWNVFQRSLQRIKRFGPSFHLLVVHRRLIPRLSLSSLGKLWYLWSCPRRERQIYVQIRIKNRYPTHNPRRCYMCCFDGCIPMRKLLPLA